MPVSWLSWLWLTLVLACASAFAAEPAGEVIYAYGITSAQRPGEAARFVAKGDPINEGDVISTGTRGFAVIGLKDGTKMTLRPNTSFGVEKFNQNPGEESALFRLLKGGVRAITGLIAKRQPQAARITTATSTIGIRGTNFDARICEADCAKEVYPAKKEGVPPAQNIVARVAELSGASTVTGQDGQVRTLTKSEPLFSGDTIRTGKGAYAVLAFRDHSKVTVTSESEFKLEDVRFSGPQADSGNFVVRVIKGGVRALTGFLAKREPKAVQIHMITATIGIRGTGVDGRLALDCVAGSCSEAAFAYTWEGAVALQVGERAVVIESGRAGVYNPAQDRLVLLDKVPQFFLDETAPRPDQVNVDFDSLFGTVALDGYPAGVYVGMREGEVDFGGSGGSIDLGPGEAGYLAAGRGVPVRLQQYPSFLLNDPYPRPENFDENTIRLLDVLNPGGSPGGTICEM